MFTFMNNARLATELQGLCLGKRSFQGAVVYAHDRLQMRALTVRKHQTVSPIRSSCIPMYDACC